MHNFYTLHGTMTSILAEEHQEQVLDAILNEYVIDSNSHEWPLIHNFAFNTLISYRVNKKDKDLPVVYNKTPSYYQFLDRKLVTSHKSELQLKACIIDPVSEHALEHDSRIQPSYVNFTGLKQGMRMSEMYSDAAFKLVYVSSSWKPFPTSNKKRNSLPCDEATRTTDEATPNEGKESCFDLKLSVLDPGDIKIVAFMLMADQGDVDKVSTLCSMRQKERRDTALCMHLRRGHNPMLCIVLPRCNKPTQVKHLLSLLKSVGVVQ